MRRREFLRAGAAALPCMGLPKATGKTGQPGHKPVVNCILLMLVGGPSQLDTWDLKPDAPSQYRGPFRPIRTNVPGMQISEIFPRMARHADKYALLRSVWHDGPSLHDAGHQFMQTGHLFEEALEHPHMGAVVTYLTGGQSVVLPHLIGNTGGLMPHGQSAGFLGSQFEPQLMKKADNRSEPEPVRARYGLNSFGQSCLKACRLVESGTRFVTVNMFETVFRQTTWDIHGAAPFSPISCYRDHVGPMFDAAYSALLEDLSARGLLSTTLVLAMGEFGRTPKINPTGGRDHWPRCSTVVMAGGGIRGGQVYGSSDSLGAEPRDNPVHARNVVATVYRALGVAPDMELEGPEGSLIPLLPPGTRAVADLF